MHRVDPAAALVFAADGSTAAAGAFNAIWLAAHWLGTRTGGRRLAAISLATLNAGIAMQAMFAQALFTAHRLDLATEPFFAPSLWIASRIILLAGTLLLSLLILRKAAR